MKRFMKINNMQFRFSILAHRTNKGKDFYAVGDFESANISFKNVLSFAPQNSEAWYLRGKCQILLLDFDEGIDALGNAIKFNPENYEAKKYRDLAFGKERLFEKATWGNK